MKWDIIYFTVSYKLNDSKKTVFVIFYIWLIFSEFLLLQVDGVDKMKKLLGDHPRGHSTNKVDLDCNDNYCMPELELDDTTDYNCILIEVCIFSSSHTFQMSHWFVTFVSPALCLAFYHLLASLLFSSILMRSALLMKQTFYNITRTRVTSVQNQLLSLMFELRQHIHGNRHN